MAFWRRGEYGWLDGEDRQDHVRCLYQEAKGDHIVSVDLSGPMYETNASRMFRKYKVQFTSVGVSQLLPGPLSQAQPRSPSGKVLILLITPNWDFKEVLVLGQLNHIILENPHRELHVPSLESRNVSSRGAIVRDEM